MPQSHAAVFKVHDMILNEQRLLFSFAPKFCPFVSCILNNDIIKVLIFKKLQSTISRRSKTRRRYLNVRGFLLPVILSVLCKNSPLCCLLNIADYIAYLLFLLFVIYYLIHFVIATSLFIQLMNQSCTLKENSLLPRLK